VDPSGILDRVSYGGNPEHKRNPGDFGLTPPALPFADASKCDECGITDRATALRFLRLGIERGLVSKRWPSAFPQNVWVVTDDGIPLEAQLENPEKGVYHGYPLLEDDPFREVVLARWQRNA
jgi:hypothetical protein